MVLHSVLSACMCSERCDWVRQWTYSGWKSEQGFLALLWKDFAALAIHSGQRFNSWNWVMESLINSMITYVGITCWLNGDRLSHLDYLLPIISGAHVTVESIMAGAVSRNHKFSLKIVFCENLHVHAIYKKAPDYGSLRKDKWQKSNYEDPIGFTSPAITSPSQVFGFRYTKRRQIPQVHSTRGLWR